MAKWEGAILGMGGERGLIYILEVFEIKKEKTRVKINNLMNGAHTAMVTSLAFNPVHKYILASGSMDKTIRLWSTGFSE